MKKHDTSFITPLALSICLGCACALMASSEMSALDGAVTAAVMAAFYLFYRLARRYCAFLEWLPQALFCGVGFYAAAQLLSLGTFG